MTNPTIGKLDDELFDAFVGLYTKDIEGNFVSLDDKYGVLKDSLKQAIIAWALEAAKACSSLEELIEYLEQWLEKRSHE